MKKLYFCILLFASFVILSCKKKSTETPDTGQSYFPTKTGTYIIYDVDSTYYDDFYVPTKVVNTKYQLKEKIQSIYYDNQNRQTARVERYVRYNENNTMSSWKLKNVWAQNLTTTTAERVEENIRYIKLIFPVQLNKTWNTNNQNFIVERNLNYKSINENETIGNATYINVLTTEFNDGEDILTKREYQSEKYVKNIGLVYRNIISVQSQPNPNATTEELQLFYAKPIMDRITSGIQYTWTINSYGVE